MIGLRLLCCVLMAGGWAAAEEGYRPPPVGTQLSWVEPAGDAGGRISEVVATGSDFVIYQRHIADSVSRPINFVAEFSGVYEVSCVLPMPSSAERVQLQEMWPLESGRTLSIGDDYKVAFEVGRQDSSKISLTGPSSPVQEVSVLEDDVQTRKSISLEWHTVVVNTFRDGSVERVRDVYVTQGSGAPGEEPAAYKLGNCAELLETEYADLGSGLE